tara:strand:+ start:916 stop:1287 length:372 start_codon:yes stop_codon:yes gene_type:complete
VSEFPVHFFVRGCLATVRCASGATSLQFRSISSKQVFLRNHQITQGAGDEQPMSVLRQPAATGFVEAKLPFDYAFIKGVSGSFKRLRLPHRYLIGMGFETLCWLSSRLFSLDSRKGHLCFELR